MFEGQVITFFSSDYRELYKGDIFRVLSLPQDYVIEFRYQTRYIDQKILDNLTDLKGKESIIFFVSGNDPKLEREKRKLDFFSIREAKIKEISRDDKLLTVSFYLQLGSFSDVTYHPETDEKDLPVYKNVAPLTLQQKPKKEWVKKIEEIEPHFEGQLFFQINSVRKGKKIQTPKYSNDNRASYYSLNDESSYQIDISCYDPKAKNASHALTRIEEKSNSDSISLHSPNGLSIDAIRKSLIVDLKTRAIERSHTFALTTLKEEDGDYPVFINWRIKKSIVKPLFFGLFSIFLLFAITIAGVIITEPANISFEYFQSNWKVLSATAIFGILGAGGLYYFFDKK